MTEIPLRDVDLPIDYEKFEKEITERIEGLEEESCVVKGITMHPRTCRTLILLYSDSAKGLAYMPPAITHEIFGLKMFPNSSIDEKEYYFVVE